MSDTTSIQHHDPDFFDKWQADFKQHPHFANTDFSKHHDDVVAQGKTLLHHLLDALPGINLPDMAQSSFKDALGLWHQIYHDNLNKGLSAKDTAMLIYSFKSSLSDYLKNSGNTDPEKTQTFDALRNLLDFLGLLTFERYSSEKEHELGIQTQQRNYLQESQNEHYASVISHSPEMARVYKAIEQVLNNDITILLEGESGTGKDMLANMIHQNSSRKDGSFVALNCGAIPKELIESELFGHEKGSFTGADDRRVGKFELAHGGTLFLDEIGDLDLNLQVKLLRVLQNREIERVGGDEKIKIDVRIIAATHRVLSDEVAAGRFRDDLFYRINVFPVRIPPLRERQSDIIPLATFFLEKYAIEFNLSPATLSADTIPYLQNQKWPGNIRELENLMQRMAVLAPGKSITSTLLQYKPGQEDPLPLLESPKAHPPEAPTHITSLDQLEAQALQNAIRITKGNIRQAAKELGISRTTFYNKARKHHINLEKPNE